MARKYHPDLNHTTKAHEQFIAVKQAYNTLQDPVRRAHYDRGLRYIRTRDLNRKPSFQHVYRAQPNRQRYRTEAERNRNYELNQRRAWIKQIQRIREDAAYFAKFKRYALWVSIGSFLLASSFFGDCLMTNPGPVEQVTGKSYLFSITQDPADHEYYRIVTNQAKHRIFYKLADDIRAGDDISVKKSPIYGMTLGIDVIREGELVRVKNPTVSAGVRFFSLLLAVSLLTFFNKGKNEWAVDLTLINLLLLAINSLMLILNLAH